MICLPVRRPLELIPQRLATLALLACLPACCSARPLVAITAPADDAALAAPTTVRVQFRTDSRRPVARVELYLDGGEVAATAIQPPLLEGNRAFTLDPAGLEPGPHRLTARALDTAGEAGSVEITIQTAGSTAAAPDTQRPSVSIYSPAQGAVVAGKVAIRAEASDSTGVRSALFYVDGKLHTLRMGNVPLSADWDTRAVTDGPHVLSVRASDLADNWGDSSEVTVVVRNQPMPVTAPGPGTPPAPGGSAGPPAIASPGTPVPPGTPAGGSSAGPSPGTGPLIPDVPRITAPEPARPPVTSVADPGALDTQPIAPGAETGLLTQPPLTVDEGPLAPADLAPSIPRERPAEAAAWVPQDDWPTGPAPAVSGLLGSDAAAATPAVSVPQEPVTSLPSGDLAPGELLPEPGPAPGEPEPGPLPPEATRPPVAPELSPDAPPVPEAPLVATEPPAGAPLVAIAELSPLAPITVPDPSGTVAAPGLEPLVDPVAPEPVLPEPATTEPPVPGPAIPEPAVPEPVAPEPTVLEPPALPEVTVAAEPGLGGDLTPVGDPAANALLEPLTPVAPFPEGMIEPGLPPVQPALEPLAPVSPAQPAAADPAVPAGPEGATPVASDTVIAPPVELYHEGPVTALPGAALETPSAGPATGGANSTPPASTGLPRVADAARLRNARIEWDGKPGGGALRPELVDGVLMVSLKHYFDAADGAVYWFPEDKLARAVSASADLTLRIGKDRAMLNGSPHDLTRPPAVRDGRVMVPLDIVAQALGLQMQFDAEAGLLRISRKAE